MQIAGASELNEKRFWQYPESWRMCTKKKQLSLNLMNIGYILLHFILPKTIKKLFKNSELKSTWLTAATRLVKQTLYSRKLRNNIGFAFKIFPLAVIRFDHVKPFFFWWNFVGRRGCFFLCLVVMTSFTIS